MLFICCLFVALFPGIRSLEFEIPHFLKSQSQNQLQGSVFDTKEKVEGTQCSVGVVEVANSDQLHSILQDLSSLTYFRLIRVNVNGPCSRSIQHKKASETHEKSENQFNDNTSGKNDIEQPSCEEEIEGNEGEAEPACSVKGVFEPPAPSFASFLGPSSSPLQGMSSFLSNKGSPTNGEKEGRTSQLNNFLSKREAQIMKAASDNEDEQLCAENVPEFWLDMCEQFEAKTTYNLRLNPESWTGYNGSALWQALYEENCFADNLHSNSTRSVHLLKRKII